MALAQSAVSYTTCATLRVPGAGAPGEPADERAPARPHAGRDDRTLCASGAGIGAGVGDAGFREYRGRHPARLTVRTIAAVSPPEVWVFPEVLATNGGALGHGEEENSERSLKVRGDSMQRSTECLTANIGSDCPAHCDWSMVNR